ncbi:DsrE/DsrF-like family protein [Salinimicrobium sediminis]|uniref:DsrE/DsrF-like family protein n=1 Tax=Salinimicrobium sediminis TaxID=1343891 RepID=A0A285X2N2_9FLAO|nr:DsrE family protein [Salinimicrobium sediminis]SOC79572.1 DsrE/DsrF-like family protein [Salinimicrobium sediminis]
MKMYFISSIVILLAVFTNPVNAQEQQEQQNYVVLTKKVPQLKPILIAAESLAREDGHHFGKFEVIICGQTVKELTNKEMMQEHINKAKEQNVELVACGFSLKKFGVDRRDISPELKVVDNGILYNLQLQKKGYISLSL